ncbi:putative Zinc finger, SWIM-type [Medicago truncatula]|uniref:Putative Zinc finger, SWIM-type n=1 Tax=Medicago truncatula TaxID=3880 RepID=A0A396HTD7_MEDTR|nr:putative Zinc finger, SWIM-type [Medicago truncatula]
MNILSTKSEYQCSFGPENYGEGGEILPSRRCRTNTRNRAARPQSMRGCTCHFVVKRLYARPSLALIVYNERRHVNKSGFICHGPLDRDAIGPRATNIPYISNEIQQQTISMIHLGIPEENILEKHIEGIERYCGSNVKFNSLASQHVHKLSMIIKRSTHELDLDDEVSIRMWVERNRKSVFFHQDTSESDPFVLGIQTEWQLQQMVRFGHHSVVAADSSFGVKRLKYPLFTLLVFDSRQHALPVAWIITRSFAKPDVSKWLKALIDRARSVEPGWKVGGFFIDDAAADIDLLRDIFGCPVLFSLWRMRRSWLRNIVRKCNNIEIEREMFKRLGTIVYNIWGGTSTSVALEQFMLDFVDQTDFMEYFRVSWVPKIEMWLSTRRNFPLASQEASGALEAYHVKLKAKLFDDSHLGALQRVDWLNVKEGYIASTSWHRAFQIPDSAVTMDGKDRLFAKVASQKDSSVTRIVWNPGSEFSFCDCSWSLQGNLCKHVIKVNTICENLQGYQPSMSFRSFEEVLMDLWRKPVDDSFELDVSLAWTHQVIKSKNLLN